MKKEMSIEEIQKRIQEVIEQIEEITFSENKAQEVTIDTEYEKNMPCDNTGLCSNTCPMYYQCNT